MKRVRLVAAITCVVAVALAASWGAARAQGQGDEIFPGCNIPKSFGHLVTLTGPGADGLAGQAVFEDNEGTIRWVGLMFNPGAKELPVSQRHPIVIFPRMPKFECTLGHVWQRH